jgi:PAS domain S-box-containing protein
VKEDITARKQAEARLLQLQKAVETTDVGVTITDADGYIVYINPADAAMHGYTVDELIGQRSNIFAPEASRASATFAAQGPEQFSNWTRERENVRKDGSIFPVKLTSNPIDDPDGNLIGNVIVCEDITARRQAAEALAQERNLLRTLIDSSPECIYVKDTQHRFVLANEAMVRSLGLTALDQLLGKTDFDVHPPALADQFYAVERPIIADGAPVINQEECVRDRHGGPPRWLLSSKVPFRDQQGQIQGIVGLTRDITELKRSELMLQQQAILLRGVAGAMNRLLTSNDLRHSLTEALEMLGFATGVDRIYLYQTECQAETGEPVMSQRLTWSQDLFEVVGDDPAQQRMPYHPHFSRWYDLLSRHTIVSGLIREFPAEERDRLNGRGILSTLVVPIFLNQEFWGFIGFDNCQTERQWHEEEESILLAMAGSIGGALARQRAETALIDANTHLQDTLDHLQRTQHQLVLSEKMAALGQLIAGVAHEINTPLAAIRSSITTISSTIHATLAQLPDFFQALAPEHQRLFAALLAQARRRNLNLSIREERAIKRRLTQELADQRLDGAPKIAELLVNIGIHDRLAPFLLLLRAPNCAQILDMAYRVSGLEESTRIIKTATDRASKVVVALKSYARYDHTGAPVEAVVTDGIETVLTLYHNHIKQQVQVIREYAEVPAILCYPDELNQVWTNVIQNALQAMGYQGTLTIRARQMDNQVVVAITDTGHGIPADVQPRIFEPFFTTKAAGEGSGLGLDIVKKIIEKHQGAITFSSRPGETTFSIALPIQRAA